MHFGGFLGPLGVSHQRPLGGPLGPGQEAHGAHDTPACTETCSLARRCAIHRIPQCKPNSETTVVVSCRKKFTPKKGCPVYSVANSKIEAAVEELCTNHQLEVLLVDRLQAEVAPILQLCTPHQPLVRMSVPGRDLTYGDGEALVAGAPSSLPVCLGVV